jgi:hypothetical protein
MKQLASAYSFDTTAKTVTLTGLDIPLSQVLVIVNATRNETIYNFADSDLGAESYTQAPDSILTLKAALTGMDDSDKLSIFYDDGQAQSSVPVVSGRVPVDIGGDGSITITSGTVTVSNEVEVTNDDGSPIPVSGPLTDTQLRASAVPVSGTVNANVTFPTSQAVTGPLTDTQLRASAVPVSGTVTANVTFPTSQAVTGPLTNTELRANPVNVAQVNRFNFVGGAGTTTLISQEVVPWNDSRNYFLFQNLSEQPVYLSFNGPATSPNSLRIDGGGAVVFDSGIVPTNQIQVLGTAAGSNYYFLHA